MLEYLLLEKYPQRVAVYMIIAVTLGMFFGETLFFSIYLYLFYLG